MANVLLVTYSGNLRTPSAFVLDNGLANLAGSLLARGHAVSIADYNSLDVFERAFPKGFPAAAEKLTEALRGGPRATAGLDTASEMTRLQGLLDEHQLRLCEELYQDIATRIRAERVTVVGFKVWGSDGAVTIQRFCRRVRADFPSIKIILGGPSCEVLPEHTARFIGENAFDLMATSKAEDTIVPMIEYLEGERPFEKVPSALRMNGGKIERTGPAAPADLDELPWPAYDRDVYPSAWNGTKLNYIVLDESRGCPNHCHFCVHPSYFSAYRAKSIPRILAEMAFLQRQLGTRHFRFAGSNTPPVLLENLAQEIINIGLDVRLSAFLHVENIRPSVLPLLHRAGLRAVFLGIESAHEETLRRAANKKFSPARAETMLRALMEAGIFVTASFIYPLPFENDESRAATLGLIRRVFGGNPNGSALFLNPFPMPHTQWWLRRAEFGFELDDDTFIEKMQTISLRPMLPPDLQDKIPFTLNGKDQPALGRELAALQRELANDRVILDVPDYLAAFADGCDVTPQELRTRLMPAFLTGDPAPVRWMIDTFNSTGNNSRAQALASMSEPAPDRSTRRISVNPTSPSSDLISASV